MTRLSLPDPLDNGSSRGPLPVVQNELAVVVTIGGQQRLILPENIVSCAHSLTDELVAQAINATDVTVHFGALPRWPESERITCLQLMWRLAQAVPGRICFCANLFNEGTDLFRATTLLIEPGSDPNHIWEATRTALAAAAVIYPNALPIS